MTQKSAEDAIADAVAKGVAQARKEEREAIERERAEYKRKKSAQTKVATAIAIACLIGGTVFVWISNERLESARQAYDRAGLTVNEAVTLCNAKASEYGVKIDGDSAKLNKTSYWDGDNRVVVISDDDQSTGRSISCNVSKNEVYGIAYAESYEDNSRWIFGSDDTSKFERRERP